MAGKVIRRSHSNKPPPTLQPTDYDHEIFLLDISRNTSTSRSRSRVPSEQRSQQDRNVSPGSAERRLEYEQRTKSKHLRAEIAKRRYAKYQGRNDGQGQNDVTTEPIPEDSEATETCVSPLNGSKSQSQDETSESEPRGRSVSSPTTKAARKKKQAESHIDILYENQRGAFLCGVPLFSGAALGAADARPWTNANHKPSLSDITNSQPPDPSWEWAWKEWRVNHDEGLKAEDQDEDGWEYSFAFSKKGRFSWHGPSWWNSCVRRRAWIRKRVRKDSGYVVQTEGHMLNSDYFTIHPSQARSHSPGEQSQAASRADSYSHSVSIMARREMEEALDRHDIRDIGHLMRALRYCRIDREKTEAVESFVEHGEDDLSYLKERMGAIMDNFIFQASRRLLLSHLAQQFDEAIAKREESVVGENDEERTNEDGNSEKDTKLNRIAYLKAAVKEADEQVKQLEFWSDIKTMAAEGEVKGAVDRSQGWSESKWVGLDDSGPRDVITERRLPGFEKTDASIEMKDEATSDKGSSQDKKGKGKA